MDDQKEAHIAVFGGGCFWCTEAVFSMLKGVISVMPGYTGGSIAHPDYGLVATGRTGHVESVEIVFDPSAISYDDLLAVFFHTHDPTTSNRQGNDIGPEYRSAIFYADEGQKKKAEALVSELTAAHAYDRPIVTEILPLSEFYPAESYHRDFYQNNKESPYCQLVIAPKLEKLQKRFATLIQGA